MTNYRVGHHCPDCDAINNKVQKCRTCGKDVGMLYDLCNECKMGSDMNEDLQLLINQKRNEHKDNGDCCTCKGKAKKIREIVENEKEE